MEYFKLYNKRERHWRIVFYDNGGRVENKKTLLHAKRLDVYVNEKENLIKEGYLVGFFGYEGKKLIWEVVDDNAVEEKTVKDEI